MSFGPCHVAERRGDEKRQRLAAMYGDSRYADCVIHVGPMGEQVTLRTNRFALAACSEVFGKMLFEHSMLEQAGEVIVPDTSPEAFEQLLRYVHELEPLISYANFVEVVQLARKYEVYELLETARTWATAAVEKPSAALKLLNASERYIGSDSEAIVADILDLCMSTVLKAGDRLLRLDAWRECSVALMSRLVRHNEFACREERLWQSVVQWAQNQPPGALQEVVPHIRFNLMEPTFFVDEVLPTAVLSHEQTTEILSAFATQRAAPNFCSPPRPRSLQCWAAVDHNDLVLSDDCLSPRSRWEGSSLFGGVVYIRAVA